MNIISIRREDTCKTGKAFQARTLLNLIYVERVERTLLYISFRKSQRSEFPLRSQFCEISLEKASDRLSCKRGAKHISNHFISKANQPKSHLMIRLIGFSAFTTRTFYSSKKRSLVLSVPVPIVLSITGCGLFKRRVWFEV